MEKAREWGKEKEVMRLRVGEQRNSGRNLPPLPRDRGYYNMVRSNEIHTLVSLVSHHFPQTKDAGTGKAESAFY